MDSPNRVFPVAIRGFNDLERLALERILKLSEVRPRRYQVQGAGEDAPSLILLSDPSGTTPDAGRPGPEANRVPKIPTLIIGSDPQLARRQGNYFLRPILALRLLKKMDELITKSFGYAPELAVADHVRAEAVASRPAFQVACAPPGEPTPCNGLPILVVDDSEAVRTLMKTHLAPCGFQVDFAVNGEQALDLSAIKRYELIFLDVMLPGLDGFEVCKRIKKKRHPAVPVVLLTGRSSRLDRLRGTLSAADHYLTKPLQREELLETLHHYFPKQSPPNSSP
jgi:two-component system, cell cycle response regulator